MKKEKLEELRKAAAKNNTDMLRKFTRRELLEAGVISFAAQAALPSAMVSLLGFREEAVAQEQANMIPFLTLALTGGASLHANYVVKDAHGALLPSYNKLGLGKAGFATTKVMGADFAESASFHKGLMSICTADILANARLVALCTNTNSDTAGQPPLRGQYDVAGALAVAGLSGKMLDTVTALSGGETLQPVFEPAKSTFAAQDINSILNAVKYTGVLSDTAPGIFSKSQRENLSSLIAKMTQSQAKKLSSERDGLKSVLESAGIGASAIISAGVANVDPRKDANARAAYGIGETTVNQAATFAGVVMNTLNGNFSHGRLSLGGFDYHTPNGTRANADSKDYSAGVEVGRILKLASLMKKPLFLYVTTDGACSSVISDYNDALWAGDYNSSIHFMIAYDPEGKITASGQQVGHYTTDQGVDTKALVGSRGDYVAATLLANYLSINDRLSIFKQVAPATLQNDDLDVVVKLHRG